MKVLNWLVSGVLISLLIVLAGVLTNNMAYVGKANADDSNKAHHASIVKMERILAQTEFDVSQKRDLLRKTRIEFYLDDLVGRAKNILVHHQTQFTVATAEFASI